MKTNPESAQYGLEIILKLVFVVSVFSFVFLQFLVFTFES